jgi:tRNA threonylcarbamoyladenosine biosynthesis protein TsaB
MIYDVMRILATDTTSSYISIALMEDETLLAETHFQADRKHTELLLPGTDDLLAKMGISLSDLDLLAVSVGPGSFAGVRIGVSTWKGLAAGADLPLIGVSRLDAILHAVPPIAEMICPMIDARMGEVYSSLYTYQNGNYRESTPPSAIKAADQTKKVPAHCLFIGDGATLYENEIRTVHPGAAILGSSFSTPRATYTGIEAFRKHQANQSSDPLSVAPLYLRKSQAEEMRDKRRETAPS